MIGARQSIGHMTVGGHPTNLDVWSLPVHKVLLVLQPANHNAVIRPCGCWGNNNNICILMLPIRLKSYTLLALKCEF